jgi:sugar (pentulose or hexulose) kinase
MPIALGLDLGTTSISAVALGDDGRLVARATKTHRAEVPNLPAGQAEQAPARIFEVAIESLRDVASALPEAPTCLGLTGQMHGAIFVDRSFEPLTNLITWQDKRSLESAGDGRSWLEVFRSHCSEAEVLRTGCTPSPGYLAVTYFTLMNQGLLPEGFRYALVVADWIAARLTGRVPRTDRTNAASTGVFDLERDRWSPLLTSVRIPPATLLEVDESAAPVGPLSADIASRTGLPATVTVCGAIGDHQAAVLGSLPSGESALHVNIGTGGQASIPIERFLRTPTSDTRYLPDGRYLLVGAGLAGGDAYAWVRKTVTEWLRAFGAERSDDEIFARLSQLAAQANAGCDGLTAEPFYRGTRREPTRRGVFRGIDFENFSPGHVARAVLEGIAAALSGFVEQHRALSEVSDQFTRVIATGNAVRRNPLLAESLACAFGLPIYTSEHEEEAAYGAAVLAGVRTGVWRDLSDAGGRFRHIQAAVPSDTD